MTRSAPYQVLSINGGSSSIKFALFEFGTSPRQMLSGAINRIGQTDSTLRVNGSNSADSFASPVVAPDHRVAAKVLLGWLEKRDVHDALSGVGHRIVHGGPKFFEPQRITEEMIQELHQLSFFAPEHLPAELMLIEAFQRRFPDLPQVGCFDTAFHHDMPRVAQVLPIPRRYESQGVRRYGFHGLSYEFLMQELVQLGDPAAQTGRVILAHLGNGASLAAVRDGKCIDTTMSFTPTAGVPMGTRSGDLDPSLVRYFSQTEQMSVEEFHTMVNSCSGLLGVSETSSDMRNLLERESTDVRAAEAVVLFCYEVKKRIGSFAAALGGIDTLVFSGGIGERSPEVRNRICTGLDFLGIELDAKRNTDSEALISTDTGNSSGRAAVRVIATDEEQMIARSVFRVLDVKCNDSDETQPKDTQCSSS